MNHLKGWFRGSQKILKILKNSEKGVKMTKKSNSHN